MLYRRDMPTFLPCLSERALPEFRPRRFEDLDNASLHPPLLIQDRSEIAGIVCLVDDDRSVLTSVARLLKSDGFNVRAFSRPDSFLEYVAANSVSLAVLDIWMEEMTGMEVLAHLCARSPETRVIFITGHEDSRAEAMLMQAGAFAFFMKPFDDDQFLNAVHRALGDSHWQERSDGRADSNGKIPHVPKMAPTSYGPDVRHPTVIASSYG
jgi:DNA-binding NtrC family response regulator